MVTPKKLNSYAVCIDSEPCMSLAPVWWEVKYVPWTDSCTQMVTPEKFGRYVQFVDSESCLLDS